MVFDEDGSRVLVPNVNIGDCDYTIAFWIRFPQRGKIRIFRSSRSWNLLLLRIGARNATICRKEITRRIMRCRLTSDVIRNSWSHVAVTCEQDKVVTIFINGKRENKLIYPFYSDTSPFHGNIYKNRFTVPQETFAIGYFSRTLIMDLDIFGFALPRDDIYDLSRGKQFVYFMKILNTLYHNIIAWK